MARVRALIFSIPDGQVFRSTRASEVVTVALYSRSRSLLHGVGTLLDERLPEEAMFLVRSLLSDSLTLAELERRPSDREALAIGWMADSVNRLEHLAREAVSSGLEHEPEAWATEIAARRRKIDSFRELHGVHRQLPIAHEKQLAADQGHAEEYWTYKYASEVIHRADLAQDTRSTLIEESVTQIHLRSENEELIAATCEAALTSALRAHFSACRILGLEISTEAILLLDQVSALLDEPAGGAAEES
jgi:hypothetical protein